MKLPGVKSPLAGAGLMLFAAMVPLSAQLKPVPPPPNGEPAILPSEVVLINRFGVYPNKITRPTGPFVLFIENRLAPHVEVFTLVSGSSTTSLLQLTTQGNKARDHAALNPLPGTYHLRFQNNPQLTVDIEITN
jgi:hypothetical protein